MRFNEERAVRAAVECLVRYLALRGAKVRPPKVWLQTPVDDEEGLDSGIFVQQRRRVPVEKQSLDASLKSENPIWGVCACILLLSLVGFDEYAFNSTTEPVKQETTILPSDRAQFKGGFTCPSDTVLKTFMDALAHAGSVHDETGELNALQQAHQAGCSDLPLQHVLVIHAGAHRTMSADSPIPAVAPYEEGCIG
jgi:hypothetical protein